MDNKNSPRLSLPLDEDKPSPPPTPPIDPNASLEERVIAALQGVYDPEIPVNIYELGLIYDLKVDPAGVVSIRMTLTSPACPVAGALPGEVQARVEAVPGVTSAKVELVWEPPWDMSRLSDEARLQLGLFD
jgi:FeS assembly SUF system protein